MQVKFVYVKCNLKPLPFCMHHNFETYNNITVLEANKTPGKEVI